MDGTLYGRVTPTGRRGRLEVHYYHLWERDCGPLSPHLLDVERVSALLVAGADGWAAKYWYAAAHEDTVCDTSHAARAEALRAVNRGPRVWVSAGKHASFLSEELCRQRGCGVDACEDVASLFPRAVINVGERWRPLNGSEWISSRRWPLGDKLGLDFDADLIAALEASNEPVVARVNGQWRSTQFALSVGGDVLGAVGAAGRHGGAALSRADDEAGGAVSGTFQAIGSALGAAVRALGLSDDRDP